VAPVPVLAAGNAVKRNIIALILFGLAFGYLEAAVVVYLRALNVPMRTGAGLVADDLFPLMNLGQLGANLRFAKIEVLREAATLLMLAAVALPVGKNRSGWLAAFALAFGIWDLSFYASLKALIGWPQSWLTWDLLFLLPVPWIGPVLAPVIVAASLSVGGVLGLLREPVRVGWIPWMLLVGGGAIIVLSFTWDWKHLLYGGLPRHFPWSVFLIGEMVGIVGFVRGAGLWPASFAQSTSTG
jgi:hypothetical protein